jgi:hypothetical protein
MRKCARGVVCWVIAGCGLCMASESGRTSLTLREAKYTVSPRPYVVLKRAGVEAVIVDNSAVDEDALHGHRAGYSGVAALRHSGRRENLFVPAYAGLNYEHIHDGTTQDRKILFEPRNAPIQLRLIDDHTAELYQPPTPHWKLESCVRYELLPDGVIEMTLECTTRARTFKNGYIGLFFASYVNKPESLDIHFLGHAREVAATRPAGEKEGQPRTEVRTRWVRGVTPSHGKLSTHLAADDRRDFPHDPEFPLTLVFNLSEYVYVEPWYYGLSHGMAFVQMFRGQDQVRLSQSPSGGGEGCPAWDFQWFIPRYEVGAVYRFVMRAAYVPFESSEQIVRATAAHRAALSAPQNRPR